MKPLRFRCTYASNKRSWLFHLALSAPPCTSTAASSEAAADRPAECSRMYSGRNRSIAAWWTMSRDKDHIILSGSMILWPARPLHLPILVFLCSFSNKCTKLVQGARSLYYPQAAKRFTASGNIKQSTNQVQQHTAWKMPINRANWLLKEIHNKQTRRFENTESVLFCEVSSASDQSNVVYCGKQTTADYKTVSLNKEMSTIGPL